MLNTLFLRELNSIKGKWFGQPLFFNPLRSLFLLISVISCFVLPLAAYSVDRLPDADIARAVEVNLIVDERIPSHFIDVEVDHGVATISGQVSDWKEFTAVVDNSFAGGAKSVKTRLEIEALDKDVFQTYFYPFENILPEESVKKNDKI